MKKFLILIALACGLAFTACSPEGPGPGATPDPRTLEVTGSGGSTSEAVVTDAPPPTPTSPPRTLTICIGAEPDSLYIYGSNMLVQAHVLQALYDGPIDLVTYRPQATILESVPSLADGDAVIETVAVSEGDFVVNDAGIPVVLSPGDRVRPAGCQSEDCAVEYSGGELQMDRLRVRFRLLEGVTWSDGTPLTAHDSVYSFRLAGQTAATFSIFDGDLRITTHDRTQSYAAEDDRTIVWTGLPGFLDAEYWNNIWTPLPEHAWGQLSADELVEAEVSRVRPLGWGPYIIEAWDIGRQILLSRNPNYYRAAEGLPNFDFLVFRFVGENSDENIARLLNGECDMVDRDAQLDDRLEALIEHDLAGALDLVVVPGTAFEHADFGILPACFDSGGWANCLTQSRPDYFGDVRVRQAVAMCMDRQRVVDEVLLGQSIVYDTYLPPQHPLFNPDAAAYPFDPAAGSALLEEAGWTLGADGVRVFSGNNPNIPFGTRLAFPYMTSTAVQRVAAAEILAASLAGCGIEAVVESVPSETFFADGPEGPLFGRRFEIGQFAWLTALQPPCSLWLSEQIPGGDFERYPFGWGGVNNPGFSSPEFDAACGAALTLLPGQPGYEENHRLAQAIFADQVPSLPLYARIKMVASRPDFCGLLLDPTVESELWNLEAFDTGEGCR